MNCLVESRLWERGDQVSVIAAGALHSTWSTSTSFSLSEWDCFWYSTGWVLWLRRRWVWVCWVKLCEFSQLVFVCRLGHHLRPVCDIACACLPFRIRKWRENWRPVGSATFRWRIHVSESALHFGISNSCGMITFQLSRPLSFLFGVSPTWASSCVGV